MPAAKLLQEVCPGVSEHAPPGKGKGRGRVVGEGAVGEAEKEEPHPRAGPGCSLEEVVSVGCLWSDGSQLGGAGEAQVQRSLQEGQGCGNCMPVDFLGARGCGLAVWPLTQGAS